MSYRISIWFSNKENHSHAARQNLNFSHLQKKRFFLQSSCKSHARKRDKHSRHTHAHERVDNLRLRHFRLSKRLDIERSNMHALLTHRRQGADENNEQSCDADLSHREDFKCG